MSRLAVTVALLPLATAGAMSAPEFLPLAPGNMWTYEDAVTGESFQVRVGTQVYANQRVYHTLYGYTSELLVVRVNEYGNIVYWDAEREVETLLTSFEVVPGATFEAPHRECPAWGRTEEKRAIHEGPAGRWSVLEILFRPYACADGGDQMEQYAENIGMVRRVVDTIAGPRTFDLVYARVGKQVISAGKVGSFSVAVKPGTEEGSWLATLRLGQAPGSGLKLRFPTSQECDVRLRDSAGNVLWTWSDDKFFEQASHELPNVGGWSTKITVPHPLAIPEDGQRYTLEAWLTTAEGEPRFAAVTTAYLSATDRSWR